MLAGVKEFCQWLINAWKEQSFPYLFPFYSRADAEKYTDLEISNICQLKYADKISKYYLPCIIVKILLSKDGVVCTVTVAFNNRRAENTLSLSEEVMEVGARWLSLILLVLGQNNEEHARVEQWINVRPTVRS